MGGDDPKYLPIELFSVAKTAVGLVSNQGLECLKGLKRPLKLRDRGEMPARLASCDIIVFCTRPIRQVLIED